MKRYVGGTVANLVFMFFTILTIGCDQRTSSQSGSDGNPEGLVSETSGYGAVVMVTLPEGGLCSGTIVSERAVLTAAHCLLKTGRYQVTTDHGKFSTYKKYYTGRGVVESTDDIGLLVFSEDTPVAKKSEGHAIYSLGDQVKSRQELHLVGFGCNDIERRTGSGRKRAGTNEVSTVSDFIEFVTSTDNMPINRSVSMSQRQIARGILGPAKESASCYGDSGGPALSEVSQGQYQVVGVTHAGGVEGDSMLSLYVNVATDSHNRAWLRSINSDANLQISGL